MTSRERIKRCIAYTNPDRCPMSLPAPYPNDFCRAGIAPDPDWKPYRTWELPDGVRSLAVEPEWQMWASDEFARYSSIGVVFR